ncbi:hypothetical protein V6R21_19375 [Limibacter armeniacum]|uniref:hypothetical protein n=1 Tax=Limibacter armeniacum TaxID=466084 RepID=UPI002FE56472
MPAFQSVDQLLLELGNNKVRRIIDMLFKHREVSFDLMVDMLDGDEKFIRSLIAKGVLVSEDEDKVQLDEQLMSFLEGFMEIRDDIQNFEIDARIKGIKRRIRLYFLEDDISEKDKYVDKIKDELKRLGKVIRRNVIDLSRLVMQDYKTADNPEVRKLKIQNHNEKADKLIELIEALEGILKDDYFFTAVQDEQLNRLANHLRHDYLKPARTNLLELSQEIVAFINRIVYHQRIFKKLMKIKRLRDHYELEKYTNIEEVLAQDRTLFMDTRPQFRTRPSLDHLRSDEGYDMILKLAGKQQHRSQKLIKAGEVLDLDMINTKPVIEQRINYGSIKDKFISSDKDLFSFIMDFPFKVETPFEERTKVFCKIALLYESEMEFSAEKEDRLQLNGKEFAKVTPKKGNKSKSKATELVMDSDVN